jgi:hypothetical protein
MQDPMMRDSLQALESDTIDFLELQSPEPSRLGC